MEQTSWSPSAIHAHEVTDCAYSCPNSAPYDAYHKEVSRRQISDDDPRKVLNILFVFACPVGSQSLRLQSEERAIREIIKNSQYRKYINFEVLPACSVEDLHTHLLENKNTYNIIHFSGHSNTGNLLIRDILKRVRGLYNIDEISLLRSPEKVKVLESTAKSVIGNVNRGHASMQSQIFPLAVKQNGENESISAEKSLLQLDLLVAPGKSTEPPLCPPINGDVCSVSDDAIDSSDKCAAVDNYEYRLSNFPVKLSNGEEREIDFSHVYSFADLLDLGVGSLAFEGEGGRPHFVPPSAFARLLGQQESLTCVVLNVCGGLIQGEVLKKTSPMTVCFEGDLTDGEAVQFSKGFYSALVSGANLETSVNEGRNRMELSAFMPGTPLRSLADPKDSPLHVLVNEELAVLRSELATVQAKHTNMRSQRLDALELLNQTLASENSKLSGENSKLKSMISYGMELLQGKDNEITAMKDQIQSLFGVTGLRNKSENKINNVIGGSKLGTEPYGVDRIEILGDASSDDRPVTPKKKQGVGGGVGKRKDTGGSSGKPRRPSAMRANIGVRSTAAHDLNHRRKIAIKARKRVAFGSTLNDQEKLPSRPSKDKLPHGAADDDEGVDDCKCTSRQHDHTQTWPSSKLSSPPSSSASPSPHVDTQLTPNSRNGTSAGLRAFIAEQRFIAGRRGSVAAEKPTSCFASKVSRFDCYKGSEHKATPPPPPPTCPQGSIGMSPGAGRVTGTVNFKSEEKKQRSTHEKVLEAR